VIIIEILDHLGRVKEYHKLEGQRFLIGRAYDNDIVINDPFVCPHHLQVEVGDDGAVVVSDMNSVNGLYLHGNKERVEQLALQADERLRIGHTTLRYRTVNHEIEPARQDRLRYEFINDALNSPWVQRGSYLVLGLFVYLFAYLDTYKKFEPADAVQSSILPIAMVLFLWAGFWAVLSRITSHRFYFTAHSIIATMMLLFSILYEDYLNPVLRFAFNADLTFNLLTPVLTFLLMAVVFYAHLRFCSSRSPRRLALTAVALSTVILGLEYIDELPDGDDFSNYPEYHSMIMPPSYQLVSDVSLDQFFSQADTIKASLEQQVQENGDD